MKYIDLKHIFGYHKVFDIRNVVNYFGNIDRRRLYEWQQKGYISKIANNYYIFSDTEITDDILREIANKIYSPSYIGLESALSYYRIIPEAVFQITSVTTLKTKLFETRFTGFSYRSVRKDLFWGYSLKHFANGKFLISDIEKTILDYFYLTPYIRNRDDLNELRLNKKELKDNMKISKLRKYLNIFSNKRLENVVILLMEDLNVKY